MIIPGAYLELHWEKCSSCAEQVWIVWRSRFSFGFINPNGPVKPVDFCQIWDNLGHHLETLVDNH
jgi:hypothetical protein